MYLFWLSVLLFVIRSKPFLDLVSFLQGRSFLADFLECGVGKGSFGSGFSCFMS